MKRPDVLRKLLDLIGRQSLLFGTGIVFSIISVGCQLYVPVLFGKAIDLIVSSGEVDFEGVSFYLQRIAVLVLAAAVSSLFCSLINNRVTYKVIEELRAKAIRKIQELPLSYLDSHPSGDLMQRIVTDCDRISDGLLMGSSQLFSGIVTIIVTLCFMFSLDVWITMMVIVLTPLSFLTAGFIAKRSYDLFAKQNRSRGEMTALINEMVSNLKVVKAFGHEKKSSADLRKINDELRGLSARATFFSSLTNPSTRAVNNIIYALVLLAGSIKILGSSLSVGGLSALLAYANQYMKPFNDISSVITELQNSLASAARVFELLEAEGQSPDPQKDLLIGKGHIEMKDVSFSYDRERKLIEDLDLDAKPGMTVAIVGPTGAGKTTLINLLMRFYDVDAGHILIDGQDINDISRKSLRSSFGMVLQDTWLKKASVRDNIRFGRPDATDEQMIEAAKRSRSWDFIKRLPAGLDTLIDDDSLSQGQKQLLCITRVMLCMPPMLILDEATSNIDTRTEVQIQKAFGELMEGRTSFIVAHRLSTIRNADIILVMKDGKIVEQGDHETLIARGGYYRTLYVSQFALKDI